MELRLLSNASLSPSVYWTTLLPPLFSGLARQPGVGSSLLLRSHGRGRESGRRFGPNSKAPTRSFEPS